MEESEKQLMHDQIVALQNATTAKEIEEYATYFALILSNDRQLRSSIKSLMARLQNSPFGDDKIDELEECSDNLQHKIDVLESGKKNFTLSANQFLTQLRECAFKKGGNEWTNCLSLNDDIAPLFYLLKLGIKERLEANE